MSWLLSIAVIGLLAALVSLMTRISGSLSHTYGGSAPQHVPFLGGGDLQSHAWQRFHVRYYSMTLLFIAFEMEMMFMYPWAAVFVEVGVKAMLEMGMFLGILAIGILYGWREGIFRWQ